MEAVLLHIYIVYCLPLQKTVEVSAAVRMHIAVTRFASVTLVIMATPMLDVFESAVGLKIKQISCIVNDQILKKLNLN